MLLFLLWCEGESWWKYSSDPHTYEILPSLRAYLHLFRIYLASHEMALLGDQKGQPSHDWWPITSSKFATFVWEGWWSHLRRQIPDCFASLLRTSASFSISITVSARLSALEYRHIVAALDSLVLLGCELSLVREGERRKWEEEQGSLNKSPSVYLIYGAIRSVRFRLKLNFSSCEAS